MGCARKGLYWLAAALVGVSHHAAAGIFCLPIYGNWCGPGHPRYGAPPPIDAFDAACMRHDLCVGRAPDWVCDQAFVAELNTLAAQLGTLPRALQWAEYVIRLKSGGPVSGMPWPWPGDMLGLWSSVATPCD